MPKLQHSTQCCRCPPRQCADSGLDANRWHASGAGGERTIITLLNRTKDTLYFKTPADAPAGRGYVAFWGDNHAVRAGELVPVEPDGVQALVLDAPASSAHALEHFEALALRADVELATYETRFPRPLQLDASRTASSRPASRRGTGPDMIALPAGEFVMRIEHSRRESGCYPFGSSDWSMWRWFYKDELVHRIPSFVRRTAMKATAVTNAEFLSFVEGAGYRPRDPDNFLKHVTRNADVSLPKKLSSEQAALPVTYVSLDDARAYASWMGQRLATEAEWQWAAEGAGRGNRYPWGNEARSFRTPTASKNQLAPAADPRTRTPQG